MTNPLRPNAPGLPPHRSPSAPSDTATGPQQGPAMRGTSLQNLPPALQRALTPQPASGALPAAVSLAPPTRMDSDPQRLSPAARQLMLIAEASYRAKLQKLGPAITPAHAELSRQFEGFKANLLARLGPSAYLPDTGPAASGKRPAPMTSGPAPQRPRLETPPSAPRLDLFRSVRAAQAKIQYFEKQQQQRCLQHAFNNLWQGRHMMLASDLALQGADMGEICAGGTSPVIAPDGACMRRIVLSSAQLRALIPLFIATERLLVFRGDVLTVDGAGHYQGLLRVGGHHFLLDSLKNGPVWLENPKDYYNELAHTPFGLVAALPGGTPNRIFIYEGLLQQGAFAAVCRALEDLYGEQPIAELAKHLANQLGNQLTNQSLINAAAGLQGADVAAFLNSLGGSASIVARPLPSPAAVHNIDSLLDAALGADDKALLWTKAQPKLIPAFKQNGQWVARVPDESGQGETMTSKPLSEVLQAQQQTWDELASTPGVNVSRLEEIVDERLELGIIQMTRWPSRWPPAPSLQVPDSPALSVKSVPDDMLDDGEDDWEDDLDDEWAVDYLLSPDSPETQAAVTSGLSSASEKALAAFKAAVTSNGKNSPETVEKNIAVLRALGEWLEEEGTSCLADLRTLFANKEGIIALKSKVDAFIADSGQATGLTEKIVARVVNDWRQPDYHAVTLQYTSGNSLPINWEDHRRTALLAALHTEGDTSDTFAVLAKLTTADLAKKRESLPAPTQHAINVWLKDRLHFPNGTGKQNGRVFITENGNEMRSQDIKKTLMSPETLPPPPPLPGSGNLAPSSQ